MPYITKKARKTLLKAKVDFVAEELDTPGELNYVLTHICLDYLGHPDNGVNWKDFSYADINEVIGALECVKLELYRRLAVPYEDAKREANGDVYPS